jgi:N utilization substance protein B
MGGEQGHKYVNGVLDKVGATLREVEYKAAKANRAK